MQTNAMPGSKRLADEIRAASNLPNTRFHGAALQGRPGRSFYQRLCCNLERALARRQQNLDVNFWLLEGFDGTSAAGTKEEVDALLAYLDCVIAKEQGTADRLIKEARDLDQELSSLRKKLSHAVAARRLRHACDLVPFF